MNLYIVIDGTDCEGYDVVSVHQSEETALAAMNAKISADPHRYREESCDFVSIIIKELLP